MPVKMALSLTHVTKNESIEPTVQNEETKASFKKVVAFVEKFKGVGGAGLTVFRALFNIARQQHSFRKRAHTYKFVVPHYANFNIHSYRFFIQFSI